MVVPPVGIESDISMQSLLRHVLSNLNQASSSDRFSIAHLRELFHYTTRIYIVVMAILATRNGICIFIYIYIRTNIAQRAQNVRFSTARGHSLNERRY